MVKIYVRFILFTRILDHHRFVTSDVGKFIHINVEEEEDISCLHLIDF